MNEIDIEHYSEYCQNGAELLRDTRVNIYTLLVQLREERGLTLQEVAQATGIPLINLSKVERGVGKKRRWAIWATLLKYYGKWWEFRVIDLPEKYKK